MYLSVILLWLSGCKCLHTVDDKDVSNAQQDSSILHILSSEILSLCRNSALRSFLSLSLIACEDLTVVLGVMRHCKECREYSVTARENLHVRHTIPVSFLPLSLRRLVNHVFLFVLSIHPISLIALSPSDIFFIFRLPSLCHREFLSEG